jgi:cell division septation protein DedD
MNINYKESQIDFLSHVGGKAEEVAHPRYMAAQMSLSLENLVIFAIVAIMVVIFSFSLGIERGKGVALATAGTSSFDGRSSADVPDGSVKVDRASAKMEAKDFKADAQKIKVATSSPKAVVKAKTAVVAPVVATAKPATAGAYTVQVASYKGIKSAQREADKLKQKGFDNVYVLPKGTYTIVCVGSFQNKEDASGIKRQLNNRYQGSVVRRL